ncbi:hypothetical protein SAY86_020421 [Trapa natans]|uniref:Uncharacterized protein n=1 Tax=Trapa natans TaxID=22666 RepID=A0AAN7LMW7_TRANT|nr:hypothetical protein SAY86_020421 [Trapa natans]
MQNEQNLRFNFVTNALVQDITTLNSKGFHVMVFETKNITFQSIKIIAPEDSPNTDGIHIGHSSAVTILDTSIETGDDCVFIGDGSEQVTISADPTMVLVSVASESIIMSYLSMAYL